MIFVPSLSIMFVIGFKVIHTQILKVKMCIRVVSVVEFAFDNVSTHFHVIAFPILFLYVLFVLTVKFCYKLCQKVLLSCLICSLRRLVEEAGLLRLPSWLSHPPRRREALVIG